MAQYYQQQPPSDKYPPLSQSYPATEGPYVTAPPPMGYPAKDAPPYPSDATVAHPQTRSKGSDGFLRGCLAALCCCWILDVCVC